MAHDHAHAVIWLPAVALVTAAVAAVRGMWSPCGLSMLTSLNPVTERARGHRFWVTACWYVAGAVVGGAALGAAAALPAAGIGALGLSADTRWLLVLVCAAVALGSDTVAAGVSLPVHPRQVDERWLTTYRRWIYAGGYGVQIGTGFATYIMSAAVYLTAALAVLTGSPATAFAVCTFFGLVRGLAIVVSAPARTPERLRSAIRRIDALGPASLRLACAAECAVATVAGWALAGPVVPAAVTGVLVAVSVLTARRTDPLLCASAAVGRDDHVDEAQLLQHGRR